MVLWGKSSPVGLKEIQADVAYRKFFQEAQVIEW